MRRAVKLGMGFLVAAGLYLLVLLVVGWAVGTVVANKVQSRLAEGFDAETRVGSARIGLVRGWATIEDVELTRDVVDHLGLTVRRLDVDLAPLGLVLFDREARRVRLEGARLVITGPGALAFPRRPGRPPIHVGGIELEDCAIELMATGWWPGLARVVLTIEEAQVGPTTLRTGLSWVFSLHDLVARVELPLGMTVRITYHDGKLSAAGGLFGKTPVEIPFTMPDLGAADEVDQLVGLGKELLKRLAIERARRLLGEAIQLP